jgi:hypothetical protein
MEKIKKKKRKRTNNTTSKETVEGEPTKPQKKISSAPSCISYSRHSETLHSTLQAKGAETTLR